MTELDTSPAARHRRLQTALRVLNEKTAQGGRGVSRTVLEDPDTPEDVKHRITMHLAGAAYREEQRLNERRTA